MLSTPSSEGLTPYGYLDPVSQADCLNLINFKWPQGCVCVLLPRRTHFVFRCLPKVHKLDDNCSALKLAIDDLSKSDLLRQKNREYVRKHREREKQKLVDLEQKVEKLSNQHLDLRSELEQLAGEKAQYQKELGMES